VTLRFGSKPSGFCRVTPTDIFSRLLTSYAGMRSEPYARGRCHRANYWELTQILVSDVDAANSIAVIGPVALGTAKHAPLDLAPHVLTAGTRPARVALVLQGDSHAQALRLVGELEANAPV